MLALVTFCAFTAPQPPMMRQPEVPPFLEHVAPQPRVKGEKLPTDVAPPLAKGEKLPADVEKAVWKAVYDKNILTGTQFEGPRAFVEEVDIPKALTDAYVKHPAATIEYLLGIAEKAEPYDSMKAAAYAMSLLNSPAVGVVVVRRFDKAKYDDFVPAWGATSRQHWINKAKEDIKPRK